MLEIPLIAPILALLGLALVFGALLGYAAKVFKVDVDPIVDQINAILPQTQCGQCGHPGCRPYAEAIADGEAINKCPPGGENTIHELAGLLGVDPLPLDARYGVEEERKIAYIREQECIGCRKCIQACPVDAILGTAKHMHTVLTTECTGCDLCVEPCPVDCIDMIPAENPQQLWQLQLSEAESSGPSPVLPCIRCGLCAEVCPASLLPQQLYWFACSKEHDKALNHGLFDCIECGLCDRVCPSNIPLVHFYQATKSAIKKEQQDQAMAKYSRHRFDLHQQRMQKEKSREAQKRSELSGSATDVIQAALARVKAKKTSQQASKQDRLPE